MSTTVPGLLRPALGLVGWTFVMEGWMYATRLPAMKKYNVSSDPNTIKEDMDKKIPAHIKWIGESIQSLSTNPSHVSAIRAGNTQNKKAGPREKTTRERIRTRPEDDCPSPTPC